MGDDTISCPSYSARSRAARAHHKPAHTCWGVTLHIRIRLTPPYNIPGNCFRRSLDASKGYIAGNIIVAAVSVGAGTPVMGQVMQPRLIGRRDVKGSSVGLVPPFHSTGGLTLRIVRSTSGGSSWCMLHCLLDLKCLSTLPRNETKCGKTKC